MVRCVMIEYFLRALFARELASTVTARGAEHTQAPSTRHLHRRRADSTAGAMHQDRLARLRVGALEQPAIRRRVRRTHGRALRERNICRQPMHLLCRAHRKLSVRTASRSRGVNTITRLNFIYIRSTFLDYARSLVTRCVRL